MRRRPFAVLALVAGCVALSATRAASQTGAANADSVFARARQLVVNGNGAAGRLLIDSVIAATSTDAPGYAEALYWRAALAPTSADAERDYRRLIVEYPISSHAGEALLQLARIEAARGDRAAAIVHLDRFMLENPASADRGRAGLLLVRISFDQNDPQHACIALGRALRDVPPDQVELRNQLDYFSPRCASVDTTRAAPGASTRGPAGKDSVSRDSVSKPSATAAKGRYTLQVAAYNSRADADRLAQRLKARGIEARIVGVSKVFRVRVGRYETRAAAAAAARDLKTKKIDAFVTEIGVEEK